MTFCYAMPCFEILCLPLTTPSFPLFQGTQRLRCILTLYANFLEKIGKDCMLRGRLDIGTRLRHVQMTVLNLQK